MLANQPSLPIRDDMMLGSNPEGISGVFSFGAASNEHDIAYLAHPGEKHTGEDRRYVLSADRMKEAGNYMIRANKSIHRSWPTGNRESNDRILRDSFLVRWCHTVYAIGLFTDDASLLKISGELAWPCQVYIDRFLYDQESMDLCKLYMFDLKSERWFSWRHRWHRAHDMQRPSGVYAVLGYDKPNRASKKAVSDLWS